MQQESQDYSLLAQSHNLLGITEFLRGNFALSLDYYVSALNYCQKMESPNRGLRGIVNSNIARLYFALNDYDHGRYYAEEALYEISGTPVDNAYLSNLINIYTFFGEYLSQQKSGCRCGKSLYEVYRTACERNPF